jgi:formate-dependent nitrite reductase cytochrome c552 subunit
MGYEEDSYVRKRSTDTQSDPKAPPPHAHRRGGAEIVKVQHPEFELWSQGVHARRPPRSRPG